MKLHQFFNERISDLAILYIKLHRFHWYIEGPSFYQLHEKYEELYDEATALYDEFAERLLAIGGKPYATMKDYLAHGTISEEGNETDPKDIYATLIKDYEGQVNALKEGVKIAEDAGDDTSADLFISTIGALQKHLWMFKQSAK